MLKLAKFISCFSLLFLTLNSFSFAANPYFLENVIATASEESPSLSRQKALADADRSAFVILLSRLNISQNISEDFSDEEISDMIGSKQIKNEKIAGNNYSAKINILFAKNFVDYALEQKKLKKKGKKFTEKSIIIAAQNNNGKILVWENSNLWKNSLNNIIGDKYIDRLIVPSGSEVDVNNINRRTIKNLNYNDIKSLISYYKANSAYVLIYNFDEAQNKVLVDLANIKKFQTKLLKLSFVNIDLLNQKDLIEKVSKKTVSYILHREKQRSKTENNAKVIIKIDDLSDWLAVKEKLKNNSLIDHFDVLSISQDYVVISINYASKEIDLDHLFAKIGMSLKTDAQNSYITYAN